MEESEPPQDLAPPDLQASFFNVQELLAQAWVRARDKAQQRRDPEAAHPTSLHQFFVQEDNALTNVCAG